VGGAATAVDLVSLILLVELLRLDPRWANVPALTLGLAVQFVGNKFFAFQDRRPDYLRQGSLFLLVEAGAFALNALIFHLLVTLAATPYLLARLAGAALVYVGFSYPLWRLIFKPGALPVAPRGLRGGKGPRMDKSIDDGRRGARWARSEEGAWRCPCNRRATPPSGMDRRPERLSCPFADPKP
jgi:putative flippase GtrA